MKQQTIDSQIKWLRISYWAGAIADLIIGVVMFFPGLLQILWELDAPIQGAGLIWSKYFGTVAILWTCLLLWADRKPLERRGVALLTFFVVAGLMCINIYAIVQALVPMLNPLILIVMQIMLLILFGFSYINSRDNKG